MRERGRFISLEGAEGAGKTTAMDCLRRALVARGLRVVTTREPGGTPFGEDVRKLLLARRVDAAAPLAETLLVFAARAQNVAAVIEPALRRGDWVLCDRYTDSTFAYQCGGSGLETGVVSRLAELTHANCWPDLTIYLDVPPRLGLERAAARTGGEIGKDAGKTAVGDVDRFEAESLDFFERVRACYRQRAADHDRIVTIDAGQGLSNVREALLAAVERFVG